MRADAESRFDVVVIGAGQSGLATGYHLAKQGLNFLILDSASEVGSVWKARWDSLKLFTPAQYSNLPGMDLSLARDTYPTKNDIASYLRSYASEFDLPIRSDSRVTSLRKTSDGYAIETTRGESFLADQAVVATGPFQTPVVPGMGSGFDGSITQIHSGGYRNPSLLPPGRVLVVGGGNSGFQIATELAATREVVLSIGKKMPALPQRFAGRDLFWWLTLTGVMKVSTDSRLGRRMSSRDVLIGSTPRQARQAGVVLKPRLSSVVDGAAIFEDGSRVHPQVVVWATGYRPALSWVEVPGVIVDGRVRHRRGVTDSEGLYFIGLPWQHTRGSALLGFMDQDADFISSEIASKVRAGADPVLTG
jgi:putative flavoprotein involved in K+ transport